MRMLWIAFAGTLAASGFGQDRKADRERRIRQQWFAPPAIDLGEQRVGKNVVATFRLRNPTNEAHVLRNITSSCQCQGVVVWVGKKKFTIAKSGHEPIRVPAGATGKIEAHVRVPYHDGRKVTEMRIETSDPKVPAVRMGVFFVPVREYVVETGGKRQGHVDFGKLPTNAVRDYEFRVRARDGKPFRITGHSPVPEQMTLKAVPVDDAKTQWKISGRIGPNLPKQGFSGLVSLQTDRKVKFDVHVYAAVLAPIRVSPGKTVVFGMVDPSKGAERTLQLSATNKGDTFRVARVEVVGVPDGAPELDVQFDNASDGRGATVRVRLPKGLSRGRFTPVVRIHFVEKRHGPVEVTLVAQIR